MISRVMISVQVNKIYVRKQNTTPKTATIRTGIGSH